MILGLREFVRETARKEAEKLSYDDVHSFESEEDYMKENSTTFLHRASIITDAVFNIVQHSPVWKNEASSPEVISVVNRIVDEEMRNIVSENLKNSSSAKFLVTRINYAAFGGLDTKVWDEICPNMSRITEILNNNEGDVHEGIYNYAVVERNRNPRVSVWFKWSENRKGFYEIDEPLATENLHLEI